MAAYLIAQHKIADRAAFEEFHDKVTPLIGRHGGRFILRSRVVDVLDGDWAPDRVVVIEFSDMDKLKSLLGSPDFQDLTELRRKLGPAVVLAVEGE